MENSKYFFSSEEIAKDTITTDKEFADSLLKCPVLQAEIARHGNTNIDNISNLFLDNLYCNVINTHLEDWLDNQDVAKMLHMSYRTLQKLRSEGILPYSRIKGKIYYRRQDIQKLMADNFQNI